jgi:hypothetical protein
MALEIFLIYLSILRYKDKVLSYGNEDGGWIITETKLSCGNYCSKHYLK